MLNDNDILDIELGKIEPQEAIRLLIEYTKDLKEESSIADDYYETLEEMQELLDNKDEQIDKDIDRIMLIMKIEPTDDNIIKIHDALDKTDTLLNTLEQKVDQWV